MKKEIYLTAFKGVCNLKLVLDERSFSLNWYKDLETASYSEEIKGSFNLEQISHHRVYEGNFKPSFQEIKDRNETKRTLEDIRSYFGNNSANDRLARNAISELIKLLN